MRRSSRDPRREDPIYKDVIEKYSYTEPNGNMILSWDIAKYVNHCCNCNIISTGYGFEIAIRDIQPGEELLIYYSQQWFEQRMLKVLPPTHHKAIRRWLRLLGSSAIVIIVLCMLIFIVRELQYYPKFAQIPKMPAPTNVKHTSTSH